MKNLSISERLKTAVHRFENGWTCSQVVLCSFSEDFLLNTETANAISCGFAGGMRCGETCGAVTAAVMVIGLWSFQKEDAEPRQKKLCFDVVSKFMTSFEKRQNSTKCKNIIGYDIRNFEERKKYPGQQSKICPQVIKDSIEILLHHPFITPDNIKNL